MISAFRHTGIVVRDIERSLLFYRDVLSLSPIKRAVEKGIFIENVVGIAGAVVEWVKLIAPDNAIVELLQYHFPAETMDSCELLCSNRIGFSHIAFTVSNIWELYQKLTTLGYHCNSEPQSSPDGKVKVLYCHDPDGIVVELVEELDY